MGIVTLMPCGIIADNGSHTMDANLKFYLDLVGGQLPSAAVFATA